jgi:hypothetical protein
MTVVLPETLLLMTENEYAPTATDMPPPYTFAPNPDSYMALQLVNVLLEMM